MAEQTISEAVIMEELESHVLWGENEKESTLLGEIFLNGTYILAALLCAYKGTSHSCNSDLFLTGLRAESCQTEYHHVLVRQDFGLFPAVLSRNQTRMYICNIF